MSIKKLLWKILICNAVCLLICVSNTMSTNAKTTEISKSNFPEKTLRSKIKKYDKNQNDFLEKKEQKKIKKITLSKKKGGINVKGLSKCTNLQNLTIDVDGKMKNAKEISKLKNLKVYSVRNANKTFDISKNKKLEDLIITEMSGMKTISIKDKKFLRSLTIEYCDNLKKVKVNGNKSLEEFTVNANKKLVDVNVLNNYNLKDLSIYGYKKQIKKLTMGKMEKLREFSISNTSLKTVDLKKMPNIISLYYKNNNFDILNFSFALKLQELFVEEIQVEELDISTLQNLEWLRCINGKINRINFPKDNKLRYLILNNNQLSGEWDLSQFPQLSSFECNNNKISKIIATNHLHLSSISCENNNLDEIRVFGIKDFHYFYGKGNPTAVIYLPRKSSGDMQYSYDKTAKVYYPWDFEK